MKIYLTDKAIKEANKYEEEIHKQECMKNPNYTKLVQDKRYFVGYLGEWAFSRCLVKLDIQFHWKPVVKNKSDDGDFFIKGFSLDVKTASKPEYKFLMFPQAQLIHYRDFYVGAKLNLEEKYVEIFGFIDQQTMMDIESKDFGKGILTKAIELTKLNPIGLLKCYLKV